MAKKVIPVMITTVSALAAVLAEKAPLLYLDADFYAKERRQCDRLLQQADCRQTAVGARGVFFQPAVLPPISLGEIYDPLGIL